VGHLAILTDVPKFLRDPTGAALSRELRGTGPGQDIGGAGHCSCRTRSFRSYAIPGLNLVTRTLQKRAKGLSGGATRRGADLAPRARPGCVPSESREHRELTPGRDTAAMITPQLELMYFHSSSVRVDRDRPLPARDPRDAAHGTGPPKPVERRALGAAWRCASRQPLITTQHSRTMFLPSAC